MTRTQEIDRYIYEVIIPKYAGFDAAHREDHAHAVIDQAMALLDSMPKWIETQKNIDGEWLVPVDREILKMAAACHDLGLVNGRDRHHLDSGEVIRNDVNLRSWFNAEEIETIAQAAEDHRASGTNEPRSIYGKLVAEADRLIDGETIIRRTIQFGFKHYPELGRDGHIARAIEHLKEKYGRGGYMKLWIPWSDNAANLNAFQDIIADDTAIRAAVVNVFSFMDIRKAKYEDLDSLMEIFGQAREIMRTSGNLHQWNDNYPSAEVVLKDIENGHCHVICNGTEILGTMALIPGPDPTYAHIEGEWPDERPYYAIHRIATSAPGRNVAKKMFDWAFTHIAAHGRDVIRIDTHRDNCIMQHILTKYGFKMCGVIYLENGDPRDAYHRSGRHKI